MRLRVPIVLVCALALLAAPARADHGATVGDPTLARYMVIAEAYWGGPEPVCTMPDGTVVHPHAVMGNDPDPNVAAWAEVGGCRIWLDSDYWPAPASEEYCNLIAHEWGHLTGREHSSDPHDLMWPKWTNNVVPQCAEFRPPARRRGVRAHPARRSCMGRRHHHRRAHGRRSRHHAHRRG